MEQRVKDFYDRKLLAAETAEERIKVITALVKRYIPEAIENVKKEQEKEFKRTVFNINTSFGV